MNEHDANTLVTITPPSQSPFHSYPISHAATDSNANSASNFHSGSGAMPSPLPATPMTPYAPANPYVRAADGSGGYADEQQEERRGLRPFLSLGARLWLTAFNPALLPLIFTVVHIAQTRSSTNDLAANLKDSVAKACAGLAKGAGALQTLPRYLAMQTNEQVLKATRATVLGTGLMLIFAVQIIEAVVNFIIDTYRSLLLCTVQLVVQGSLEILIGAVQEISEVVTNSLNAIRTNIQDDIAKANSLIQTAANGVASVLSRVGIDFSVPEISVPALSWLQNVTIPNGFENSLLKLNASLPNLDELRDKMNSIVDIPLEALIKEINSTRLDIAASLNDSTFPVPSLQSLAGNNTKSLHEELCTDMDTSVIDNTAKALYNLGTVAIWGMVVAVLVAWLALAFWQWRRWRALKDTVEVVGAEMGTAALQRIRQPDPWAVVAVVEHPVLERYCRPVFDKFNLQPRTRNNVRWFLSYLAHPTCLTLLFMAVVGFVSIECQILALHALQAKAKADAAQSLNASTADFAARLNNISAATSRQYAAEMNGAIRSLEDRINNDMFGNWVNGTAVTLNTTLVQFYSEVQTLLNTAFGGTILYNPINNFVYCLVGSKITNLEKGLTWVSEHAHVTLPTVGDDVLLISPASAQELATPLASAAVGDDSGDGGAVGRLVAHFEKALNAEKLLYAALLAVYGLLFCAGLAVVIWHSGGREKYAEWKAARAARNDDSGGGGAENYAYGDGALGLGGTGYTSSPPRTFSRAWPWTGPLYGLYARKREHDAPPPDTERGLHQSEKEQQLESSRTTSPESIADLAAPGQAFLALHSRSENPTPERVCVPLPPLPPPPPQKMLVRQDQTGAQTAYSHAHSHSHTFSQSHFSHMDGSVAAFHWETEDPVLRPEGTPAPETNRRTLVVANRNSGSYPPSAATSPSEMSHGPTLQQLQGLHNPENANADANSTANSNPGAGPWSKNATYKYTPRRLPPAAELLPTPAHTAVESTPPSQTRARSLLQTPTPTSSRPASPSPAKTTLRNLLLPAIERRKRAMEEQIDPFIDPTVQVQNGSVDTTASQNVTSSQNQKQKQNSGQSRTNTPTPPKTRTANPSRKLFSNDSSMDTQEIIESFPTPPGTPRGSHVNPFGDQNPFAEPVAETGVAQRARAVANPFVVP